jgi:predicted TIM-barrel enzyme
MDQSTPAHNAEHVHSDLNQLKDKGSAVVVAGVGSGLTALGAKDGGADVLAVYSTAVYRIKGLPSALAFLPYDDANQLTLSAAREILPLVQGMPTLLGFGVHDPRVHFQALLDQVEDLGASGITNEPFIGIYGAELKCSLERAGLGFERELRFIQTAVHQGFLALGWAFDTDEVRRLADAGCQLIGFMSGVTATPGGAEDHETAVLDEAVSNTAEAVLAARERNRNAIVLCHGGPLNDVETVRRALHESGADGYVTGSTGERIPARRGVSHKIAEFKALRTNSRR